jgi:hypothetical protein
VFQCPGRKAPGARGKAMMGMVVDYFVFSFILIIYGVQV